MEIIGELSVEIQVLQAWVDRENAIRLYTYSYRLSTVLNVNSSFIAIYT